MPGPRRSNRSGAGAQGAAQVAGQRAAEKEAVDEAAAERAAAAAEKATALKARKAEREAATRANEAKADAKRRQREEDARLAMEQQEAQLRDKEARKAEKEVQRCAREREKQEAREATEGAARAALLPTTAVAPGITSSATRFCDVLRQVGAPPLTFPPPLPSLTAHPQTAQISRDLRPEWQSAILVPLLASEPNPNVLIFAAECIEVLHKAYAAGKAYPKSQVLEAEAAASCQAGGPLVMRELRCKFTLLHDGPPPDRIGVALFELWGKVRTEFNFLNMPESKVRPPFEICPQTHRECTSAVVITSRVASRS